MPRARVSGQGEAEIGISSYGASSRSPSSRALWIFAWVYYAYLLFVIAFGAWVRISGSGAGCGESWPTCHGEIVPRTPELGTFIEYTHRLTSGLLGVLSLVLVGWVFLRTRRLRIRVAAIITLWFVIFEALIGAGIVLKGLVAEDASVARAIVISLHLANTLTLSAAAGLTAWWLRGGPKVDAAASPKGGGLMVGLLVALVFVSMTGAVTALGDTLFPVSPTEGTGLLAHIKDHLSPSAHFLVRLRIVHPIAAVLVATGLLATLYYLEDSWPNLQGLRRWAFGLVLLQLGLGSVSILLGAPGWMQIAHLLVAQLLWLCFVLLTAALVLPMTKRS